MLKFPLLAAAGMVMVVAAPARADWVSIQAVGACRTWTLLTQLDVGHANIGFWDGNGKLIESRGYNTGGLRTIAGSAINDEDTQLALNKKCNGAAAHRFVYVTPARRAQLQGAITAAGQGCNSYLPIGKIGGKNACSCVTFATRAWLDVTKRDEQWTLQSSPALLAAKIFAANGKKPQAYVFDRPYWSNVTR